MQKIIVSITMGALFCSLAFALPPAPPKSRFARQGELQLNQLVTPGFDELPLNRKLFVYWLTEAMEAGRDIAWIQQGHESLPLRQLFEKIWSKADKLTLAERGILSHYYFQLMIHHGVYDANTNQKIILEGFEPAGFVKLLNRLGIPAPANSVLLALFSQKFEAIRVANLTPPPSAAAPSVKSRLLALFQRKGAAATPDLIADSGVNFFGPGVTQAMMDALPKEEREHILSYPMLGEDGKVKIETFREAGIFGEQLREVSKMLEKAKAYARADEVDLITQYQKVIKTGDHADAAEADRLWVLLPTTDLTFHLGFTEPYDDPMGVRGTWEGFILLHNQDPKGKRISKIVRDESGNYEQAMTVPEEFKKNGDLAPPKSEGAYLLYMTGGNSESFFAGKNLPNDPKVRETIGSKSFTATNQVDNLGEPPGEEIPQVDLDAFYLPAYHSILKAYGRVLPRTVQVEFHEILGHGSGRDREGVNSSTELGAQFMGLEESRAELASLFHLTDVDRSFKIGLPVAEWTHTQVEEFSKVALLNFFTDQLDSYRKLKGRKEIRQAHQLGRQIILNHLLQEHALEIVMSKDGVPQVLLTDFKYMRASLGRLLWRQQTLKSTADLADLTLMTETLGALTDKEQSWIPALDKAAKSVNRPDKKSNLNPAFYLVKDQDGTPVDVELRYADPAMKMEALFDQEQRPS